MTQQEFGDPHRLAGAAVVVGVDGSAESDTTVRWAAKLAAQRGRELHIVHGLDLTGMGKVPRIYQAVVPQVVESVRADGTALLRHAEQVARALEPRPRVTVHLSEDGGTALLLERSATAYAVVMGATGTAGTVAHLGSTLLTVTSHARGPVVVVRPDPEAGNTVHESGPVVVGVDGSPISEAALAAAFAEAAERRTTLIAVHVWSDWSFGRYAGADAPLSIEELDDIEDAILAERLAGWQEKYPDVDVVRRLYFSDPVKHLTEWSRHAHLTEWSRHAQLLVVGTRGRGGLVGMLLLGSTSHSLVQHAHCPVLVVHPAR
ncbi:universal stress protein [Nocardia crassostreae]|uniref:universal stress protein n=1 Tax=Nocardia crassostreae TaxID=53428 RepID=UPI0008325414|nr:universal stress protein [Nocardia crassostreae]